MVADAARNQLTSACPNFLVAEKARRLLGPSVAMRFADIILPDIFFLRGWSSSIGQGKCCTILQLELEVVWPRRKKAKRGNSIKLVEWTPKSQLLLLRPFSCEDAITFSTHSTSPVVSHSITHTCAQEERSGFHLTDSQPARVSCSK